MASELSKFIDDELQKVDTAEERERLISKLRVRTTARDPPSLSRAGPSWQEQLLPRKRLLIIAFCAFLLTAVAAVAVSKGSSSGKGVAMDESSEYAYGQDQQDLINSAYPMPGEPSSDTLQKQGQIPPPDREQGVESNAPGSPATNIRDDSGSSVTPENASGDELDKMPPIPSHHKHPPPAPSTRKMGPSTPSTTPATASSKGTQAPSTEADSSDEQPSEEYDEMSEPPDEYGVEAGYESEPGQMPVELAPTPELAEQQADDRRREEYEAQVEKNSEMGTPEGPTKDRVFDDGPSEDTESEAAAMREPSERAQDEAQADEYGDIGAPDFEGNEYEG